MKKTKMVLASKVEEHLEWIEQWAKEALKMAEQCKGKAPYMDMDSKGIKFVKKLWVTGFYAGKIDAVKALKEAMRTIRRNKKNK